MKRSLWLISIFIFTLFVNAAAQKKPVKKPAPAKKTQAEKPRTPAPADHAADEKKVRDMISFLQYMLNAVGGNEMSARDKEVLISQSYSKIFRDSKVQVEDDLDAERKVITNKDVMAYLKDVDFFFRDVEFEITIENIKSSTLAGGELFYKVSARRSLTGTTTDGNKITNSIPRYIEVNYNPDDQDLKIVSMYTNEFNEKRALTNWWNELSYEWQSVFRKKLNLTTDSLQFGDIKRVTAINELNLAGNSYIRNIEPLAQLSGLQKLNISGTFIDDITPIRNLTELIELNAAGTKVSDLTPLRYSTRLEIVNINDTDVSDITVVERMLALKKLEMKRVPVSNFTPLANLTALQTIDLDATKISDLSPFENLALVTELNISGTQVQDLTPLKNLKELRVLDIDSTRINSVQVLGAAGNLEELRANHTSIADLAPLQKLPRLERVYCDQTRITKEIADAFRAANPDVLVIFDSKDLRAWWGSLPPEWQTLLSKTASVNSSPNKEELARIPLLDSINLNGNTRIRDLEPLTRFSRLRSLNASRTGISDIAPLRELTGITYLDISETAVSDISILSHFNSLKVLRADKSKIENIEQLELKNLEQFFADQTSVHDITAREFLEKNPDCLLIYKTVHLNRWWSELPENWKGILKEQSKLKSEPSRESLHKLVEQPSLKLNDVPVSSVSSLREFVRLRELHILGSGITKLSFPENLKSLRSLHVTNGPLQKIDSIFVLSELEDLNISNTPIEDIYPVWKLKKLRNLNCAGTQIRRLDALEKLEALEYLDCSNTNVSRLNALDYLPLKTLKCYNTKVSARTIENFAAVHPECNVIYYR